MFEDENKLEHIRKYSFHDSGLEEFMAPPGLKKIEDRAFSHCKNLRQVELNEGLTTLGEHDEADHLNGTDYFGVF